MKQSEFIEELKKIGIEINDIQLKQLNEYYKLIVEYNKQFNLTSILEEENVYLKHFYDSLTINKVIDLKKEKTLCDIGTGAGFPGLVLKIVFPNLNITLVDSLNKRIKFLNVVIEKLELKNIEAIHYRAEEFARLNRNKYDITTSRAVAHLSNLLEYTIPMTKVGGYFIALKGNVDEELSESKNAIDKLKVELESEEKFKLPVENSNRTLLKFKKKQDVKIFPRKYSDIKKKRL